MDPHKSIDLHEVANFLRDGALGYKQAKAEYEGMREVRYFDLNPHVVDTAKLRNVIANTIHYVDSIARGAAACLADDTFFIDYDLRTNLLGKVVYGERHSVNLSFRVNWVVREVVAGLYTGKRRDVNAPNDLRSVLWERRVRNLEKFAEMTGLDERHVGPPEGERLLSLFQYSSVVQCKLTRLVKGCLIYLDHLDSGTKTYVRAELPTLDYNVKELLKTMHFSETAYVYTTHEWDSAYNLILYAMCQQYPSPLFGGVDHVKIPADGDAIYLVGYSPMKHYRNVVVSPELVIGTLIEYSNQFWLGEELESAMIIACSLRQNRYLEKIRLPAVLSNCDLIYPALSGPEAGGGVREKPILSKEAAVMLGRSHQMACLVLFKDFDTSFRADAERNRSMRSLFSMHGHRIITEDQMSGGILPMADGLLWLECLKDDGSMARLREYSVFEGFWLVKKNLVKVLEDGIIRCIKRGVNNHNSIRIRNVPGIYIEDSFDVLMEEVILGGGDSELTCSDGAFNVGVSCIRRIDKSRGFFRSRRRIHGLSTSTDCQERFL